MSISPVTCNNYNDVLRFFMTVQENGSRGEKLGGFEISIFNHDAGDKNKIAHISFDENKYKLNRIDGNHRLSAADDVTDNFKIPFCAIFCRNGDEEYQCSRAIFHNINAKQIPLNRPIEAIISIRMSSSSSVRILFLSFMSSI